MFNRCLIAELACAGASRDGTAFTLRALQRQGAGWCQPFCLWRGRWAVWEERQAVIAGGGISLSLLFALSQLTVKIILF